MIFTQYQISYGDEINVSEMGRESGRYVEEENCSIRYNIKMNL